MRLTLVLTHRCDLACSYCYAGRKFARDMPLARAILAVDRALRTSERLSLGLFGGEPLLVWPLAREVIRHARAQAGRRLSVEITTNGTRLDETLLAEALELGVRFSISMDGLAEDHDRFRPGSAAAALAAIDRLVRAEAEFEVVSVVRPETVARLPQGVAALQRRGVSRVHTSLDFHATWRPVDIVQLRRSIEELGWLYEEAFPALSLPWLDSKLLRLAGAPPRVACGVEELAVAPSGRLYPCERLVGADEDERFVLGHLEDSLGPFRELGPAGGSGPGCETCAAAPLCTNDCACVNAARSGSPAEPDGLVCALEQACLEEAFRLKAALEERAAGSPPRRSRRRRLPEALRVR